MRPAKLILVALNSSCSLRRRSSHAYHPLTSRILHDSPFSQSGSRLYSQFSTCEVLRQRRSFLTSTPDVSLSSDLISELEQDLKKFDDVCSYESVIYILRKLDKCPEKVSEFFNWVRQKKGFKPNVAVYALAIRIFASGRSMKHFWVTAREMKEAGFYIDRETHFTVLSIFKTHKMSGDLAAFTQFYDRMVQENAMDGTAKKVASLVLGSDWNSALEEGLLELKLPTSESFVLHALRELRASPLKSLAFFNWVRAELGYSHNCITYNGICRVLSRSDSVEEFWCMVREMRTKGYEMDIDTYIKISRQFQKGKMMEDAVKLYELMMDGSYRPSNKDCVLLLRALSMCPHPNLGLVFRVTRKYEETGSPLPKAAYDGIHRSLTSLGNFTEAEDVVTAMRTAGHEPDNITYSQAVFGLCKSMRIDEARDLLKGMEERGCTPDLKTWTVLIQGCCAANGLDRAIIYLAEMLERKCDPDADVLDILVSAFISQKRVSGAQAFLMEMVNGARLRPWQATFKILIQGLLTEGRFEEALEVLSLMKKHNYPPFSGPFHEYISKSGTVSDALKFLKTLSYKDYPPFSAYLDVLNSFSQQGRHSEARDILFKCPHHIRSNPKICRAFEPV